MDLPPLPLSSPAPHSGSSLQKANKNRAARPWIITMGHRPMYCSNADLDDCTWHESKVRTPPPPPQGAEIQVWGWPESPLTSLLFLPRFAKASWANYMDWRIFSTNTVRDPRESLAPPPTSWGFRGLTLLLLCLRGRPAAVGSRALV